MDCSKPQTQYVGDLPIDNLDSVADYFIAERDTLDMATGNTVRSFVRVPGAKLFPNANMDNIVALVPNNTAITAGMQDNHVYGVYVENQNTTAVMQFADAEHPATMLAVGKYADMILCQCSGFVNIPESHGYILGQVYYQGDNGEPVTNPESGQALFIPVSDTKLAVKL